MRRYFEVRQQVKLVNRSWLEQVYISESERVATMTYKSLVAENPDCYFELVEVEHNEKTVLFTSKVDS